MQSDRIEVAVWRAFRRRGTPHYPGSNRDAISAPSVLPCIAFSS